MANIFLSASVPNEVGRLGYDDSDPYLIRESVAAVMEVALGRETIIWGGHPAITPLVYHAATKYETDYLNAVILYQSEFFRKRYPEENTYFKSTTVEVAEVPDDREASLAKLRRRMFTDRTYSAAIFIGGMEGVVEEYELLRRYQPQVRIIAFPVTGGAAKVIYEMQDKRAPELENSIDFTFWLYRLLDIDMRQKRDL